MTAELPAVVGGPLAGLSAGSRVAGYRIEEQVGAGGMAAVYRAVDERLGRVVALKVLAPALASDEAFRHRFIRESRAAAAVDDPHIIPVHEAGEAGGVLFIAMRYVPGRDVRALLHREGPLPPPRSAAIISPVASALDAAHAAGLVHRDVKPANMLLDVRPGRPDHVYLSDFGLSKGVLSSVGLTGIGQVLGTPNYTAPEQIQGKPADGRADQYALACSAYEMLTGQAPFQRDDAMAVIWSHLSAPPPPLTSHRPDLPAAADQVFARALAKQPADRYDRCADFAEALREALGVTPYHSGPDVIPRPEKPAADHPLTQAAWPADAVATRDAILGSRYSGEEVARGPGVVAARLRADRVRGAEPGGGADAHPAPLSPPAPSAGSAGGVRAAAIVALVYATLALLLLPQLALGLVAFAAVALPLGIGGILTLRRRSRTGGTAFLLGTALPITATSALIGIIEADRGNTGGGLTPLGFGALALLALGGLLIGWLAARHLARTLGLSGRNVRPLAVAFGMTVIGFDLALIATPARQWDGVSWVREGFIAGAGTPVAATVAFLVLLPMPAVLAIFLPPQAGATTGVVAGWLLQALLYPVGWTLPVTLSASTERGEPGLYAMWAFWLLALVLGIALARSRRGTRRQMPPVAEVAPPYG